MRDCLIPGLGFFVIGIVALLSSLTKTGRNLDRAYLKSLPRSLRVKTLEPLRNPIAALVGGVLSLVGIVGLMKAVHAWWTGTPCG
jgi:hypothetical protein